MDLLSMLVNAQLRDLDGGVLGEVFGVHITGGKLYLTIDVEEAYEDPDDGDKEDIPDDDASKNAVTALRAVGQMDGPHG